MSSQSIPGYFEHIRDKTYIDKYPGSIIRLDDLKHSKIVEFGSGVGNDVNYLISEMKCDPQNLFLIESDIFHFIDTHDNLERLLFRDRNYDEYLIISQNFQDILPCDLSDCCKINCHF